MAEVPQPDHNEPIVDDARRTFGLLGRRTYDPAAHVLYRAPSPAGDEARTREPGA